MDFRDALISLARRGLCNQISTRAALADSMQSLRFSVGGVSLAPAGLITVGGNTAANLLNCPASGGPYPPTTPTPEFFPGGQCSGVLYDCNFGTGLFGTVSNGSQFQVPGPVGQPFIRWIAPAPRQEFENGWQYAIVVKHGAGEELLNLGGSFTRIGDRVEPPQGVYEVLSSSVTRVDGQPDDCGDAPGPVDLGYDDADGNPQSQPVTVTVGSPIIDVNGNYSFPVRVVGDGLDVNISFPVDGSEPQIGPPGSNPDGSPCCPDGSPDADIPEGSEPEPPGGDRPILGCFVVVDAADVSIRTTQAFPPDAPVLHFPRLGNIIFIIQSGNSRAYTNPVPVQLRRCYVPAPEGVTVVGVIPAEQNGTSLSITPVYANIADTA